MKQSFNQVFEDLTKLDLHPHELKYLTFHHERYRHLIHELGELMDDKADPKYQILDIGPAFQTFLLRKLFKTRINSLGENHRFNFLKEDEEHFEVDLNFSERYQGKIIQHDVIVMGEVIEHLFTKSEVVLNFLLNFLKPGGYLIIQTPNPVSTSKRIRMLMGSNPFELIRNDRRGHYREYTTAELRRIFNSSGLDVVKTDLRNYFGYTKPYEKVYRTLNRFLPANFKDGITIIGQKIG